MFFKFLVGVLFASIALAASESYDGYKIYDIYPKNAWERSLLLKLAENGNLDFFHLPRIAGKSARVMVEPDYQRSFETIVSKYGLEVNVFNEDVGASIAEEKLRSSITSFPRSAASNSRASFDKFLRFDEINAYLEELAAAYPQRVIVKTIGKSFENRDIKTITISNGDGRQNKKVILVDAGIHAREWIAPATALYTIKELVENYPANAKLLKDYDWVILPVVNPDGYEYTHTNSRMWRKTRKPVANLCYGTDGNRNFNYHWGEKGASTSSCSDTYMGPTAFSEPETQTVRDLMKSLMGRAQMYLTLHSYGNYLLYPWGYTSKLPDTWLDIDEVAKAGAAAIKASTGSVYTVGSSTNVLYAASGGSDDYALAVCKIPIAITMELPKGGRGFDPNENQILPFCKESWIGIKAMAEKVMSKY